MRKFTVCHIVTLLAMTCALSAGVVDPDGQLRVEWSPPAFGGPVDQYLWSYNINGITDSVTGQSDPLDLVETSVTLTNLGDWAVFLVRAISENDDTSMVAVSDTVYFSLSSDMDDDAPLPENFAISVFPNPVSAPSFALKATVPSDGTYEIEIVDILGRRTAGLTRTFSADGEYELQVNGGFASGVYFAIIRTGGNSRVAKFTVLR